MKPLKEKQAYGPLTGGGTRKTHTAACLPGTDFPECRKDCGSSEEGVYLGWKRLVPDYQQAKISLQIMFVDTVSHLFNGFTLCHVNFEAPVVNYLSKRMSCTHVTTSPTLPVTTCSISACLSTTCNTKHARAVLLRILLPGAEGGGVVSKHTGAAAHVLGGQVRKRTRHE